MWLYLAVTLSMRKLFSPSSVFPDGSCQKKQFPFFGKKVLQLIWAGSLWIRTCFLAEGKVGRSYCRQREQRLGSVPLSLSLSLSLFEKNVSVSLKLKWNKKKNNKCKCELARSSRWDLGQHGRTWLQNHFTGVPVGFTLRKACSWLGTSWRHDDDVITDAQRV